MAKLYNILLKRGQLLAFSLGLIIVLIFFFTITANVDAFEMMNEEDQKTATLFDFGLRATIFLIFLNAVIAVLFGLWFLVKEPKRSIKMIIGFALVLIIGFIAYSSADPGFDGPMLTTLERFNISEGVSKLISAGLSTTLILGGLAAFAIVVGEVINIFKN
ncbi:MAG: hypothetical protein EA409_02210 [Saprospirales bacterium]|nr:MAG: hypothetical protein EA409_02210 [Saprospirales bacterium]